MSASGVRHFLDLTEVPKAELRGMIDASCAILKGALDHLGEQARSIM